ncbi:MAG: TRAP transporter large permease [Lachnospiraceae bacterium]|nr:TRAP transporter large permease [Lachnospiraceae bacterium]
MNPALIAFLIMFLMIFLLRMPVVAGMFSASIVYFIMTGTSTKMAAQQCMSALFSSYTIIAVPLFIFTANVMNHGKVTNIIFDFASGLVGKVRGGLGHVNVIASLIFAGCSGSAIADAAGLGKMEIDSMRAAGYDDEFSSAITIGSSTLGPIFPPSITLVIYAMLTGTSTGALFLGGMMPALVLSGILMIYVAIVAKRKNYPRGERIAPALFLRQTLTALPALMVTVIMLAGIYTGVFTPTEAGAIAGLYALIISIFVYRMLDWQTLKTILTDTVKGVGSVSIMVGAAYPINYIVTSERIAANVAEWFMHFTDNPYVFLLIVNLLFLALGCIVESNVIMMVFVPILFPVVQALGIDLVHFGVMVTFNIMIGLITPPFGMLLFVTSGVSGIPLKTIIKGIWPMLLALLAVLVILTYVPDCILCMPRLFLGYGG